MEVTGRGQLLAVCEVCKRNNVGKKPLVAPCSLSRLNNQQRLPTKPCTLSSRAFCRLTGGQSRATYRHYQAPSLPPSCGVVESGCGLALDWHTLSHRLFGPLLLLCCDWVVTRSGFTGIASCLDSTSIFHHNRPPLLVPVLPSPGTRLPFLRCFKLPLPPAPAFWPILLCAKLVSWIEMSACAIPQTSQVVARASPSHAPIDRVS